MKVLMMARFDLFESVGGDTVQIMSTKKALERQGIKVDLSLELEPNMDGYDVAHVFNLTRPQEPYIQVRRAKRHGLPLVMSTIYWNMEKVNRASARYHLGKRILGDIALDEDLKAKLLGLRDVMLGIDPGYALRLQRRIGLRKQQEEIVDLCDMLLPNSMAEAEMLISDFGTAKPYHIVHNAVDPSSYSCPMESVDDKRPPFVLSVGNLTIRKNQVALIRAVRELGLHLVLVGGLVKSQRRYAKECLDECHRSGFEYLGLLPREKIVPLYYSAKVHALVSWVETPGLANLEAGLCGCNIVSTVIGGTREYYQTHAFYCNPEDQNSIVNAISSAFYTPKTTALAEHISKNFTWERAAEETIKAYQKVLETR